MSGVNANHVVGMTAHMADGNVVALTLDTADGETSKFELTTTDANALGHVLTTFGRFRKVDIGRLRRDHDALAGALKIVGADSCS